MSYNGKVYRKQGGNELVVASGGTITVRAGGIVILPDTTNGKTYKITIENGVVTPVEV